MWKDARHVWFIACTCLLHPTLASFSLATNYRRGCAIPPSRTIRHVQVPVYEAKGCCTRVYNCVLIHGLHCASKQLTPCDKMLRSLPLCRPAQGSWMQSFKDTHPSHLPLVLRTPRDTIDMWSTRSTTTEWRQHRLFMHMHVKELYVMGICVQPVERSSDCFYESTFGID